MKNHNETVTHGRVVRCASTSDIIGSSVIKDADPEKEERNEVERRISLLRQNARVFGDAHTVGLT